MDKELLTRLDRSSVQDRLQLLPVKESNSQVIADQLAQSVFDQAEACRAVGRRLNLFETGLSDPDRPLGVLYFVGPTGSGKTEMAHAVTDFMFRDGSQDRLKILNMSEYAESHYASRLVGSPPSYVGWDEEAAIPHDWLHKGRSVIVFDEIEKAHPKVHKMLLSVFDRGKLNARNGREGEQELNFTNSLIILTSNVAGKEVADILRGNSHRLGFNADRQDNRREEAKKAVDKGLREQFPPEFLGRIDDVVVFNPIESRETKDAIITKFMDARNNQLTYLYEGQAPYIALTREARDFIIDNSGEEGGRAIKKALELYIFDRMADVMGSMDFFRRPFVADIEDGNTEWYTDEPDPEPLPKLSLVKVPDPEPEAPEEEPEDIDDDDSNPEKQIPSPRRRRRKKNIIAGPKGAPQSQQKAVKEPVDLNDPENKDFLENIEKIIEGGGIFSMAPGYPNGRIMDIYVNIRDIDGENSEEATVYNVPLGNVPTNE